MQNLMTVVFVIYLKPVLQNKKKMKQYYLSLFQWTFIVTMLKTRHNSHWLKQFFK